ncbi:MAG TPA: hypothetical protein VGW33_12245 [Terriglobia bacterium]|nr:hypothetical protein [Terriglobia bacterium]
MICLSCQHIIVRPREKRHAKRGPAAKRARAAAMSAAEATS